MNPTFRISAAWSAAVFIAAWWLLTWALPIPAYLIPTPQAVGMAFLSDPITYLKDLGVTALQAAAGFAIALVLASAGAVLLFRFRWARTVVLPWATALQATPIVCLAPLAVVWLGAGFASITAMSAVVAFFPMLAALLNGFAEVDRDTLQLFRVYRADYKHTLRYLFVPASLPALAVGMKVSAGLAVVGALVAQMTGADSGLGQLVLRASYRFNTPQLFVAIILSGILGMPDLLRRFWPAHWESGRTPDSE
jgi:NitT/TauT family transport system permease protein